MPDKVHCKNCTHFRFAPYESRLEGCYFPGNMKSKQDAFYLDEQQLPGKHEEINFHGDCADYQARAKKESFWRRLTAG